MKIYKLSCLAVIFLACVNVAQAVSYVPLDDKATVSENPKGPKGTLKNLKLMRNGFAQSLVDVNGLNSSFGAASFAECATPPTVDEIGGDFELNKYVMTRSAAGKLGLVPGNITGNAEQLLAIFDFTRSKECLATDGKTRVIYGQAVRTVLTFVSADSKAEATFPLIAASATVSGKSSSVSVKNIGFNDQSMSSKAVAMSAIALSVESYSEFSKLHKELIDIATSQSTNKQVKRLGIVTDVEEGELKITLPTAFALQAIKDGRNCNWAKQKLNLPNDPDANNAISSTYLYLTGACADANPAADAKAKAEKYLKGMTVRI